MTRVVRLIGIAPEILEKNVKMNHTEKCRIYHQKVLLEPTTVLDGIMNPIVVKYTTIIWSFYGHQN